jgi:outer membrane protein TolC
MAGIAICEKMTSKTARIPGMKTSSKLLATFITLSICGCATQAERRAFQQFDRAERQAYVQAPEEQALPVLNEEASLPDYLAYAAFNNPGLEAAFYTWKAELEKIPQVRSLPDPHFTYAYFIEQIETRVGPQRQKFGISQMFPWYRKLLLRGDVALEKANAARERYEAKKLALFFTVKDAYAEYYYLSQAIALTKENVALVKYLEQVARTKYMVGAAGHPAVIKAQVELGRLDDRLRSLEDLRQPLAAKLNAALGRPADVEIPWPKALPEEGILIADEELLSWLKDANPELRALRHNIEAARQSIQLAKQLYFPDITLGVDYIDTEEALMPTVPDSGKDPVVVMLMVSVPIWYERYRAAVRESEAKLRMAKRMLADKEYMLESEMELALFKVRDAERKIDLFRDTLIPKAKQSLQAAEAGFKAGETDFLSLLDAQRLFLEFELSHERAVADYTQGLSKLERLVGQELPRLAPAPPEVEEEPEKVEETKEAPEEEGESGTAFPDEP